MPARKTPQYPKRSFNRLIDGFWVVAIRGGQPLDIAWECVYVVCNRGGIRRTMCIVRRSNRLRADKLKELSLLVAL